MAGARSEGAPQSRPTEGSRARAFARAARSSTDPTDAARLGAALGRSTARRGHRRFPASARRRPISSKRGAWACLRQAGEPQVARAELEQAMASSERWPRLDSRSDWFRGRAIPGAIGPIAIASRRSRIFLKRQSGTQFAKTGDLDAAMDTHRVRCVFGPIRLVASAPDVSQERPALASSARLRRAGKRASRRVAGDMRGM